MILYTFPHSNTLFIRTLTSYMQDVSFQIFRLSISENIFLLFKLRHVLNDFTINFSSSETPFVNCAFFKLTYIPGYK